MKLTELEPAWLGFYGGPERCGVEFTCPCKSGCAERLHVMFDTSIDGIPAPPPYSGSGQRWKCSGTTFEDLTLTPSVDASGFGHWHGWVTNGEIR